MKAVFSVTMLALVGVAQNAAAASKDAFIEAVRDCGVFVDEKSVEGLGEPSGGYGGDLYVVETANDAGGFTVERTHSTFDDGGQKTGLWDCKIKTPRSSWDDWKALDMGPVLRDAQTIFPALKPAPESGTFLRYHDCTEPTAPVSYSFSVHEAGSVYASVSVPALDPFACLDTVKLNDLFYACIYSFAEKPWAAYRAANEGQDPPDRRGLTPEKTLANVLQDKTVNRVNSEEVEVQTDFGTVTLLRSDGPRVQCTIAGLQRDAAGTLVASHSVEQVDTAFWFMRGVSGFYPGFYFQPDARGYFTCATSFPNVALLLRDIQLPNGDTTYSLAMEHVDDPRFLENCPADGE